MTPDPTPLADIGALEQELESLRGLLYVAPVGLIHCELPSGRVALMNAEVMKRVAPLVLAWDGDSVFDLFREILPDLRVAVELSQDKSNLVFENRRVFLDARQGSDRPVWLSVTARRTGPDGLLLALTDVTAEVERELELRRASAWIGALVHATGAHMTCIMDARGVITQWTPYAERLTGFGAADMVGKPYSVLFGPREHGAHDPSGERLNRAANAGWDLDDGLLARKNQAPVYASTIVTAHDMSSDHAAFALVARDMSGNQEAIEKLRSSTVRDQLTGTYNRAFFFLEGEAQAIRCKASQMHLSIILVDLDNFKTINDRYGHVVGDQVLRHASAVLRRQLRGDAFLARIGGEEFTVLVPDCSPQEARSIAERLRRSLEEEACALPDGPRAVTASFGIASRRAPESLEVCLQAADRALYQAKHLGRNRVCLADGDEARAQGN